MPAHFSGGGWSDFVRRVTVVGLTLTSPRFVFTTGPAAPTMSPRSRSSSSAHEPSSIESCEQNSWRSPDRSRITTKATPPRRRSITIRPATVRTWSVSWPRSRESNSRRTSAASASLAKFSAKGGTPRAFSRSSVSRRAATTLDRRPRSSSGSWPEGPVSWVVPDSSGCSSGGSGIRAGVPVEDQTEPLEREPRLVVVDPLAVRGDDLRQAAGDDDRGVAAQLLLHPLHDAVDLGGGAEHEPGLQRVDRVLSDDGLRRDDLDPGQARGLRVDDAVRADLPRVVGQDRDPRLHAGLDDHRVEVEVPPDHLPELAGDRRDHGGDDHARDVPGEREALLLQESAEREGQLVGRPLGLRRQPPVPGELLVPEHARHGLGVAHVDGQQHRSSSNGRHCPLRQVTPTAGGCASCFGQRLHGWPAVGSLRLPYSGALRTPPPANLGSARKPMVRRQGVSRTLSMRRGLPMRAATRARAGDVTSWTSSNVSSSTMTA